MFSKKLSPFDVESRLEAIEAENERLREHIEHLKEVIGIGRSFVPPLFLFLTVNEAIILGMLYKSSGELSKEKLMHGLYNIAIREEPDIKIVDVFICKLRKKVKPYNIEIQTKWGVGYFMASESKKVLKGYMDQEKLDLI